MQQSTLRLTLDVDYDLNGESISSMKTLLDNGLNSAIGNGLLSGHTEAEVISHEYTIKVIEPTPATEVDKIADGIGCLIEMSRSHIEDIDIGLADGSYEAADNEDIEDKRAAMELIYGQQGRIKACLNVCEEVDTRLLADMSAGHLSMQRDRAYLDRSMYQETRGMLDRIVQEIDALGVCENNGLTQLTSMVVEARRLLKSIEDDAAGRPGGKLVRFVEQVAEFKKWGDTAGHNETDEPSDGMEDSHSCLMDLIDQARDILKA